MPCCLLVGRKEPGIDPVGAEANPGPTFLPTCPAPLPATRIDRDTPPRPPPPSLPSNTSHRLPHTTTPSSPPEAMTPAKIAVIFFAISFFLLLSHARSVPDDIFSFSTAVSMEDPPEDNDRTATVVPLKKSIPTAVEPFHRVDLSLRRPIGRHIRRPIDPHFPLRLRRGCHGHHHGHPGGREIPYGDDMIGFPRGPKIERGFPGEMRSIPMRGPRIPRGFPGEMRSIPMKGPEFQSGFWEERPAMVHRREAEGREASMKENVWAKREEERKDEDFVKRFWAIVNPF